jgi:hypothetical protein
MPVTYAGCKLDLVMRLGGHQKKGAHLNNHCYEDLKTFIMGLVPLMVTYRRQYAV